MDNTALVTNAYNQIAEKYTDQYFYDATDYPFVDNFLHLLPVDGKILDVGSGPGNFSRYIKEQGYAIEGVDLSEKMIVVLLCRAKRGKAKLQNNFRIGSNRPLRRR